MRLLKDFSKFVSGHSFNRETVRFSSSPANDVIGDELIIQDDHFAMSSTPPASQTRETFSPQESELVFFRSVVFSPEVPIRLDYHGKSVNMDQVCDNFSSDVF